VCLQSLTIRVLNLSLRHTRFNANDDDSGIYECRAINEFGEISQKLVLVIYTMPTIYPATDEVVKVTSNSDVVLRCDATGNPFVRAYNGKLSSNFK
jgi:hypothetical protein